MYNIEVNDHVLCRDMGNDSYYRAMIFLSSIYGLILDRIVTAIETGGKLT